MAAEDTPEPLRKWLGHVFSSGCYKGDDYKAFQSEYGRWLKKVMPQYRVTVNGNHYEFSAVVERRGSDGEPSRFVYVSISDVRFFPQAWASHVLVRTMEHAEDWIGGHNTYCTAAGIPARVDELMGRDAA